MDIDRDRVVGIVEAIGRDRARQRLGEFHAYSADFAKLIVSQATVESERIRMAHSIKGSAGMFGLQVIQNLAGEIESLFISGDHEQALRLAVDLGNKLEGHCDAADRMMEGL